jgi:hypothetical protein
VIIVTLDCGDRVACDDGKSEVTEIEACPECSSLIRERMADQEGTAIEQ